MNTLRNYLMSTTLPVTTSRFSEAADIRVCECVNGTTYYYYTPWYTTFSYECEMSWWLPKPSFNLRELQQATMLEF